MKNSSFIVRIGMPLIAIVLTLAFIFIQVNQGSRRSDQVLHKISLVNNEIQL